MPSETGDGDALHASGRTAAEAIGYADYAADIEALNDRDALMAYTDGFMRSYGFRYFTLTMIPPSDATVIADFVMMSNVPDDLADSFDKARMLQVSTGFRRLQTTTTPFRAVAADMEGTVLDAAQTAHLAFLDRLGLHAAYYFPVHDASGGRAVFMTLSDVVELSIDAMTDLSMLCLHVYNRLVDLDGVHTLSNVDLSERETQCLTWTAAGKTSSEIADILGLSEHTINHYLNHVARKLGAVNRIQAVVKAIRLGLIT